MVRGVADVGGRMPPRCGLRYREFPVATHRHGFAVKRGGPQTDAARDAPPDSLSCVRLPLMLASALCEHALVVWNRMRVVVLMLAAGVPLASTFAPPAGLTLAGGKLTTPLALSARRPVRLTELKASFTGLADPKYPLAPTVTGGPRDESDYTVPEWRKKVDLKAWGAEIRAVEKKYRDAESEEDVKHMKKMLSWTYVLYAIGLATAGIATALPFGVNPISALCLSTAICMRWTMIGHHVCHGGYNKLVGIGNRWHRSTFARGPVARFMDWCDWMLPEAWDVEHNALHHYELGEGSDPDLLERNAHNVRIATRPKVGLLLSSPLLCVSSRVCASCLFLSPVPLACLKLVPKLVTCRRAVQPGCQVHGDVGSGRHVEVVLLRSQHAQGDVRSPDCPGREEGRHFHRPALRHAHGKKNVGSAPLTGSRALASSAIPDVESPRDKRAAPAAERCHSLRRGEHDSEAHTIQHANCLTPILPPHVNQAPGDFGDVTKAATIKHAVSEMFKLNFLPAKVLFSCLAPYFTAHFVITPLVFYALFGQVRGLECLCACVGGVLKHGPSSEPHQVPAEHRSVPSETRRHAKPDLACETSRLSTNCISCVWGGVLGAHKHMMCTMCCPPSASP